MVRGSAWLSVDSTNEPDVALSGGDLAVLPLGHTHVLRDHPRSAPVHVDDVAQCDSRSVVMHLEIGAKGPETNFVTGAFVLDDPLARQILAVLPPVIRMRPEVEQGVPSFAENIQFITREVETDRPGSEIVLLRMADVIFIQILRAYLARVPDDGGGFLGALRDPSTAAALGAMHDRASVLSFGGGPRLRRLGSLCSEGSFPALSHAAIIARCSTVTECATRCSRWWWPRA